MKTEERAEVGQQWKAPSGATLEVIEVDMSAGIAGKASTRRVSDGAVHHWNLYEFEDYCTRMSPEPKRFEIGQLVSVLTGAAVVVAHSQERTDICLVCFVDDGRQESWPVKDMAPLDMATAKRDIAEEMAKCLRQDPMAQSLIESRATKPTVAPKPPDNPRLPIALQAAIKRLETHPKAGQLRAYLMRLLDVVRGALDLAYCGRIERKPYTNVFEYGLEALGAVAVFLDTDGPVPDDAMGETVRRALEQVRLGRIERPDSSAKRKLETIRRCKPKPEARVRIDNGYYEPSSWHWQDRPEGAR